MDVKASTKYLRISPRKVRLIIDSVRSLPVETALDKLTLLNKKAVRPVVKLINSAIANAENNFKLKKTDLVIKYFSADEGPTLKRWRARAFGRAAMIRKRTTHLNLVLTDGLADVKPETEAKQAKAKAKPDEVKEEAIQIVEKSGKQPKSTKSKTAAQSKKTAAKQVLTKAEKKSKK